MDPCLYICLLNCLGDFVLVVVIIRHVVVVVAVDCCTNLEERAFVCKL